MFATAPHRRWTFGGLAMGALLVLASVALFLRVGLAQGNCQLVAGYEQDPPYHFQDEKGKVIGIDADILRSVLSDVGCQLVFELRPWKRTLFDVCKKYEHRLISSCHFLPTNDPETGK